MAVVSDFVQIVTDAGKSIPVVSGSGEVPLDDFHTGGREAGSVALLLYSVKNLTGSAHVFINGHNVGTITASPTGEVFSTQMIGVKGTELNDGNNNIVLKNVTDTFTIKNVNLFFHQSA